MRKELNQLLNLFESNEWVSDLKSEDLVVFSKEQQGSNGKDVIRVEATQRFRDFEVKIFTRTNHIEHSPHEAVASNNELLDIVELANEIFELQKKTLEWVIKSRRRKIKSL